MTHPNPQAQIRVALEGLLCAEDRAALADAPAEVVETRKEWRMASAYGEGTTLQDEDLARFRFERYYADDPGVWLESRTLTITATPWTREKDTKE